MSDYTVSMSLSPINYTVNFQEARSATISIGTITTGAPGSSASVVNVGTTNAAVFNITIPRGDTGAAGTNGANGTNGTNGTNGAAATISIGTITTGAAGSSATVTNVGTTNAAVLNITIPRGETGAAGTAATITVGTVTIGLPGTLPTVSNVGTTSAAVFNFQLPGSLFPVLLGSVRAAAYTYNVSDQTTGRYGQQPSGVLSSGITPTSNFTKGLYGENIATGQTYNIGHGSYANYTAPETYVWLVRLVSASATAKMRTRSYNLLYNAGAVSLWYADLAALGTQLIAKTVAAGDVICCAWSGNATTTRCALLHAGAVLSASKNSGVYTLNATTVGTLQVGAGNGGAGGGIEFIGAFSFAGLMTEDELKALVQVIYNQNMP